MKIEINGQPVWVNYHHLYCFFVIASEGGLSSASKRLGIGQSALSIQLKRFEESLDSTLFERSHRKLALNENGRLLLSYAKEIFRLGGEMVEVLKDRPAPGRIHLQVGALDTIPKHLTLQLAQSALAGGKCSISILEGKPRDLLEDLSEHRIDLLLTNFLPIGTPDKFFHKRIARLPLWIVGDKSHRALKKGFPDSLNGKAFIMPTADSGVRQEVESFLKRHAIAPDVIAEAQDVMIQKLLALRGVGLTVVPEFAIREYLASGDLFLIGRLGDAFEDLYLASASRRIENPVASRMMKSFRVS